MTKTVLTGLLIAAGVIASAAPAAAQTRGAREARTQTSIERQERLREKRLERQERLRETRIERHERVRERMRMQRQTLRLDRDGDHRITRREAARYRAELRRAIRSSMR